MRDPDFIILLMSNPLRRNRDESDPDPADRYGGRRAHGYADE